MVSAKRKGEQIESVTDLAPDAEVAARTADSESGDSKFEKDFVVIKDKWAGEDWQHEANIEATRQAAINQGVRPTEHGSFVGEEDHEDGVSLVLKYAVAGVPAHVEDAPEGVKVIEDPENESGQKLEDAQN